MVPAMTTQAVDDETFCGLCSSYRFAVRISSLYIYRIYIVSGGELLVVPHEGLLGHNSSMHAIHLAGCFSGPRPMHERRSQDDESSQ